MARPDHSSDSDRTAGVNDKFDKYDTDPKVKDVERDLDHIDSNSTGARIGRQIEMEAENGIKYRTCSWQKTAALLFSEYICLAMMSFPQSYSVLGFVPAIIFTIFISAVVLYTSLIIWRFCLRHPELRDVCDIGQYLFWDSKIAWWATAVMFVLNNTFIQGLHCVVGATYLNTMTDGGAGVCSVIFSIIIAAISFFVSLPRTFDVLSHIATASAFFTFISVLLAMIFIGRQAHPPNYDPSNPPIISAIPLAGTTFVSGMGAFLNISYTFIGQITLPSFIAEMKEPRDFWKSVTSVTIAQVILYSLVGSIIYAYTGAQTDYISSPAFGSIADTVEKKVAFSFMIPTLIFLGVLYASVTARFVFFNLFDGTRHKTNNTVVGWAAWAGILAVLWVLAFIVAEVIPFFSDLESILSSLFDSFFGFIFWGVAYIRMHQEDHGPDFWKTRGIRGYFGLAVNIFLILIGIYFVSVGTYASVESVLLSYAAGEVGGVFSCKGSSL